MCSCDTPASRRRLPARFRSHGNFTLSDTLLCHDDELEGRRIAYILYLTPSWREEDGGTLDLFNTDGKSIGTDS